MSESVSDPKQCARLYDLTKSLVSELKAKGESVQEQSDA